MNYWEKLEYLIDIVAKCKNDTVMTNMIKKIRKIPIHIKTCVL